MASQRFEAAVAAMDAANADDPNRVVADGVETAKELLYAQRMTAWLERLVPDATETLSLAARCQHIRRWEIPRADYPQGRTGYLKWRTDLKRFHADVAGEVLAEAGYDADAITRIQGLVRKERLKQDAEAQALEDVACLVFLEHYFADFSKQYDEAKIIDIVAKTWKKMSPAAHEAALEIEMPAAARALVETALAGAGAPEAEETR